MSSDSLSKLQQWGFDRLKHFAEALPPNQIHPDTIKFEVEEMLCHAAGVTRSCLIAYKERAVSPESKSTFEGLIERRAKHEPLAQILGVAEFFGYPFKVDSRVLIPRSETEIMVERVLELLRPLTKPFTVLDVGVGSGAILLSTVKELKKYRDEAFLNKCSFIGIDVSIDALSVARENAELLEVADRLALVEGDVLSGVSFDKVQQPVVIVSNPPYIADKEELPVSVSQFEPLSALRAGPQGMDVIERLFEQAQIYLNHGAVLLLELGYRQDSLVKSALRSIGEYRLTFHRDLRGYNRIAEIRGSKCESFFPSTEENN